MFIYEEKCTLCHGFDGNSIIPETPDFGKDKRLDKAETKL